MTLKYLVFQSRYQLFFKTLPFALAAAGLKITVHYLGWEFIPSDMAAFFPGALTGIIFLLGFVLAGVISDYKESEKMPNDLAASLFVLWQESDIAWKNFQNQGAITLHKKLKQFVPMLKKDFFIDRNNKLAELVETFSDDFSVLDQNVAAPLMGRLRQEQANIRKTLGRIEVIKDTDFAPSVYFSIRAICTVFLTLYCCLQTNPTTWWGSIIVVSLFSFVISTIILIIADIEDPFEYGDDLNTSISVDEVNLDILDKFHCSIKDR